MSGRRVVIRKAPGDKARDDLAHDLQGQLTTRLLDAVPVAVLASQAAPTGATRVLELAVDDDSTEDLKLSTGGVYLIPHGLGRPLVGRVTTWATAFARVKDVDPPTVQKSFTADKYFAVEVDATATYRFMVW